MTLPSTTHATDGRRGEGRTVTFGSQIKEEFYLQRASGDEVPVFIDATRYARQGMGYPLAAKRALKATCGVWTDDEVVAFSLRTFSARQAEREVETIADTIGGTSVTQRNVLRPRMPRKTLHELREHARALSVILGSNDVIAELDGELNILALTRTHNKGELTLTGRLSKTAEGYVHEEINDPDAEFKLPPSGVRLRLCLRSPIRQRVIAYAYGGHLSRKPGGLETVTRATALALNDVLGLATFRLLAAIDHVEVPPAPGHVAIRPRPSVEPMIFTIPVLLFTYSGEPAAQGHVMGEIDLERLDPATGGLALRVSAGDHLEWSPAVAGSVRFEAYQPILAETLGGLIGSSLGPDAMRDIACDITLGELTHAAAAGLRAAIDDLPGLAATPVRARVKADQV
jgi:hypothetical protein